MQTAKGEALRARLVPGRLARPGAAGAPQSCSLPLLRHLVFVLTAQPRPRVLTSTFSPIFICIPCPWTRRLSCILQALERSGPGVGRVGAPRTCRGQAAGCGACGPPAAPSPPVTLHLRPPCRLLCDVSFGRCFWCFRRARGLRETTRSRTHPRCLVTKTRDGNSGVERTRAQRLPARGRPALDPVTLRPSAPEEPRPVTVKRKAKEAPISFLRLVHASGSGTECSKFYCSLICLKQFMSYLVTTA